MTRTLIYVVIAAVLGFGVWFFLFRDGGNGFSADAGFHIKDTGNIGRIFLADRQTSTTLTRNPDNSWTTDGQYGTLPSMITQLLTTLATQEPQAPVSASKRDLIIRSLAGNAIKVEIYDRSNALRSTIYVGGEAGHGAGTYMLLDGAETPYIVQIPGFDGYVTPRYFPGQKFWRDRAVFNIADDRMKEVTIHYPHDEISSFTAVKSGDAQVSVNWAGAKQGDSLNRGRARSYFRFFDRLYAEGFGGGPGLDSVFDARHHFCDITVRTTDGKDFGGKFYYMPLNKRSKNLDSPELDWGNNEFDSDRFYAVMNNNRDTFIAQYATVRRILRKGGEFYTAGATEPNP